MKHIPLWLLLAALALAACQPSAPPPAATPTAALATLSAQLPTTLAAFRLPEAATPQPSPTPTPLPHAPYPGPAATLAVTLLPLAPIIGQHVVQPGETIFCIGRAYGVLPAAIAQANGLSGTFALTTGQVLRIPAVQWTDIVAGAVCAAQFQSTFPGLVAPTAGLSASDAQLRVSLELNCVGNCGSQDGNYLVQVRVTGSGGVQPYGYIPAKTYDISVPHCTTAQGTASVTSATGDIVQQAWMYRDVACPPGNSPH